MTRTPSDRLLTPEEAGEMLGCSAATVEERLNSHELPGVKYGRGWRLPEAALMEHLNRLALQHVRAPKARTSANDGVAAVQLTPKKRQPPPLASLSAV